MCNILGLLLFFFCQPTSECLINKNHSREKPSYYFVPSMLSFKATAKMERGGRATERIHTCKATTGMNYCSSNCIFRILNLLCLTKSQYRHCTGNYTCNYTILWEASLVPEVGTLGNALLLLLSMPLLFRNSSFKPIYNLFACINTAVYLKAYVSKTFSVAPFLILLMLTFSIILGYGFVKE